MVEPYRVDNVRIISNQVYTNTVPCGYFRGPGLMQSVFASESIIDDLAHKLGIDPYELRLRNVVHSSGDAHPDRGWSPVATPGADGYQSMRAEEILRAAADAADYATPAPPNVGRGIALHGQTDSGFDAPAAVNIHPDGRVVVNTMTYDPGVGTGTILAQIVAEELGVPIERVTVETWSTEAGVRDWGIGGQRGARVSSRAAYEASQEAKRNLRRLAAEFYGWTEESIEFKDGQVSGEGRAAAVAIEEIATRAGEPVGGQVTVDEGDSSPYISFGTHIAEVEVDPETGEVTPAPIHGCPRDGPRPQPHGIRRPDRGRLRAGHRPRAVRGTRGAGRQHRQPLIRRIQTPDPPRRRAHGRRRARIGDRPRPLPGARHRRHPHRPLLARHRQRRRRRIRRAHNPTPHNSRKGLPRPPRSRVDTDTSSPTERDTSAPTVFDICTGAE